MSAAPGVHIPAGEGIGWAIDEGVRLTREALDGIASQVDLPAADVVLAVWWESLLRLPSEALEGKRILCHMTGEPRRYMTLPAFRKAIDRVGLWIARTSEAFRQLETFGIASVLVPHLVDTRLFRPLPVDSAALTAFRSRWRIPSGRYLVGSFQRDTEGRDLRSPKLVKGPDILLEVVRALAATDDAVHLLLAGPRRHWILRRLEALEIPHTYVGRRDVPGDDLLANRLPRTRLNLAYNLLDAYLACSRSEGAPNCVVEAAAAGCPILCRPVGLAHDVLEPDCVYRHVDEAVRLLREDRGRRWLPSTTGPQRRRVLDRHTPGAARPIYQSLFDDLERIPVYRPAAAARSHGSRPRRRQPRVQATRPLKLGIWHRYVDSPWGGGNQFMTGLLSALRRSGMRVRVNAGGRGVDAYLANSIHFDPDRAYRVLRKADRRVVHRIDGPIQLIRGFDHEKDEACFELNREVAGATVVQSAWSLARMRELGYRPVGPVIVHNAADPRTFHRRGRIPFSRDRRIRLISTCWSPNERKGGPIYQWIERNLDWSRYEYTFVGRASVAFDRARHLPPVPAEELGRLLRQSDIYITASRADPCSNALVEALTCGLPALYMNDGGHPELVGAGGLPFDSAEDVPSQLDRLVDGYESFQRLIAPPRMDAVVARYMELLRDVRRGAR